MSADEATDQPQGSSEPPAPSEADGADAEPSGTTEFSGTAAIAAPHGSEADTEDDEDAAEREEQAEQDRLAAEREEQLIRLFTATVIGPGQERIGKVGQVYLDDQTQEPNWITVRTGLFGTKEFFIPLDEAQLDGKQIIVPYTKADVITAPVTEIDQNLSPAEEDALYGHYRVPGRVTETLDGAAEVAGQDDPDAHAEPATDDDTAPVTQEPGAGDESGTTEPHVPADAEPEAKGLGLSGPNSAARASAARAADADEPITVGSLFDEAPSVDSPSTAAPSTTAESAAWRPPPTVSDAGSRAAEPASSADGTEPAEPAEPGDPGGAQ